jgi:gliding motility-associated-like protein
VGPFTFSVDGQTFTADSVFTNLAALPYSVSVRDACTQADSNLVVAPGPEVVAAFATTPVLPAELIIPESQVVFANQSQNATSFSWSFGDGATSTLDNPTHQYGVAGEYTVTLVVTDGVCSDSATSALIRVIEFAVFVPNVLTPNNDGINDVLRIGGGGLRDVEVFVFDRWGNQVFGQRGDNVVWAPGNVPEGVYTYVVRYTTSQNVTQDRSGTITLLR